MTTEWSAEQLERIGRAEELQIATHRVDGTVRRWVPIWVVCVGGQVYVRTWHRRDDGWFGHAVNSRRARIRVPGLEADVTVEDVGDLGADVAGDDVGANVGDDKTGLRGRIDAAYHAKYARYGDPSVDRMVTDDAAASTLRLIPSAPPEDTVP